MAMKQVMSTAGEKVKLTITSRYPRIPSGEQGKLLPMLVRVEAPPTVKKYVPVDLVALLDVSDTMLKPAVASGKTTRMDLLKKAMKFVIKQLHEDDGLAIVPFNEEVLSDYSTELFRISDQQGFAQNMVDKLKPKGDITVYSPALELAVKTLDERTDAKNRVGVIMLLSDGMESKKAALHPLRPDIVKKYPVYTFGICDHDPNVLLSIAQQSGGTYSFVDDNELGKIADPFAIFLGGLNTIVAVDVLVQINGYTTWRSVVKEIQCGFQSREMTQPASVVQPDQWTSRAEINIPMLFAGEVKNFIAKVQIDPDTSGTRAVLNPTITYKDAPGFSPINGDGHRVFLTTGKQAGDSRENSRMVREQIIQFSMLDKLTKAQLEFKNKKNNAKDERQAQIEAGEELQTNMDEWFETLNDDLKDDIDLEDRKNEIREMASRLKSGRGMAYMCSWLSSQQMQRATTLGSVATVGTQFFTPVMERKLRESKKYHVQLLPPGKLAKREKDWEDLKETAKRNLLGQPGDSSRAKIWSILERAINKAKKDDIDLAKANGETFEP